METPVEPVKVEPVRVEPVKPKPKTPEKRTLKDMGQVVLAANRQKLGSSNCEYRDYWCKDLVLSGEYPRKFIFAGAGIEVSSKAIKSPEGVSVNNLVH